MMIFSFSLILWVTLIDIHVIKIMLSFDLVVVLMIFLVKNIEINNDTMIMTMTMKSA